MIDTPQIFASRQQIAAVIRFQIPRSEIRMVMGPGMAELMATLAAQGIAPAGPMYSHHFRMHPDVFDFEIGVPVSRPVEPSGRVEPGELRAARVARTIYRGPYEQLGDGWGELMRWMETNGHQPADDLWEIYVTGPESALDPAQWETELNRKVKEI